MIRLAALAAAILMLGGCEADYNAWQAKEAAKDRAKANREKMASHFAPADARPFEGAVVRHDDHRAVTCWVYTSERRNGEAGISCIPDWMLTAPKSGMAVRP